MRVNRAQRFRGPIRVNRFTVYRKCLRLRLGLPIGVNRVQSLGSRGYGYVSTLNPKP